MFSFRYLTLAAFFGLTLLLPTHVVFAADPQLTIRDAQGFSAQYVGQSMPDPIAFQPGETKTITVRFRNTGTKTWTAGSLQVSTGNNPVTVFTVEPKYRTSDFQSTSWLREDVPAVVKTDTPPGGIGEVDITLTAPQTSGAYKEEFHLAAWNYSWVNNGYFWLDLTVSPNATSVVEDQDEPTPAPSVDEPATDEPKTAARLLAVSQQALHLKGGEAQSLVLIYQNQGEDTWNDVALVSSKPDSTQTFADSSWESHTIINEDHVAIESEGIYRQKLTFRAPGEKGEYRLAIAPKVNGVIQEEATAFVSVVVTADAPRSYRAVNFDNTQDDDEILPQTPRSEVEPRMRVGLWKPEAAVQLKALESDMNVFAQTRKIAELPKGETAVITGGGNMYYVMIGMEVYPVEGYVRLAPKDDPSAVSELVNYDRKVSAKSHRTYNQYRGAFEVRYDQAGETLWVINDLLMSDYMKGMGENSNISPMEYLKSQAVAQRTYAYYIKEETTKHDKRNFDVVATTGDQLYLGYVSEKEMPRFVDAVIATRGMMVGYDTDDDPATPSDIVITPYFGHSNGTTRSWASVWGGSDKPWLVPVVATYDRDAGRQMFGHGVGMSQLDAAVRAQEEGLKFDELLKYYYTGTEIVWMYR